MNERSTGRSQMSGTESAGIAPRALCYFTWKRRKRIAIEISWKFHQRSLRVFLGRCVFSSNSEEQQDRRGCEKSGKGQRSHYQWVAISVRRCTSRAHVSTGWNESHVEGLKLYDDVTRNFHLENSGGRWNFKEREANFHLRTKYEVRR